MTGRTTSIKLAILTLAIATPLIAHGCAQESQKATSSPTTPVASPAAVADAKLLGVKFHSDH